MGNLWFKRVGVLLASAVVLSACGGGGGGGDDSTSTSSLCGGPTLFVGLVYPIGLSATQNTATTWTPTVTGLPAACAGKASYSLATGPLPAGMAVNGATGAVSGTPTNTGRGFFSVKLTVAGYASSITSSSVPYSVGAPPPPAVAWVSKTDNTGMGATDDFQVATVGTDLYAVVTKLNTTTTNNYTPFLYRSTDGGVTWVDQANFPNSVPSLHAYSVVSNGTSLFVIGGKTSNAAVTVTSSLTYSNAVWKFTPGLPSGAWVATTAALFPTPTTAPLTPGRELTAAAFDGASTLYVYGGSDANTVYKDVYTSANGGVTWTLKNGTSLNSYLLHKHCLVANGSTLYSFGGAGYTPTGTVFSDQNVTLKSLDGGANWSVTNSSAISFPRYGSCAALNGKLVYAGGLRFDSSGNGFVSSNVLQSSDGGTTWFTDAASLVFANRYAHGMTVRNGKLVVLGGKTAINGILTPSTDVIEGTP